MRNNQTLLYRRLAIKCLGAKCIHCGATEDLEIHHVIPIKDGGTDEISNIRLLCHRCHLEAHGKSRILRELKRKEQKEKRLKLIKDLSAFDLHIPFIIEIRV